MKNYTNEELQRMLDQARAEDLKESELEEDLLIEQPDGSRACLNWELRGQGYQIIDTNRPRKKEYWF